MPTLPNPISSTVFADRELTNELKWYQRIFTPINQIITYLQNYLDDTGWLNCTVSGTNWTSPSGVQARRVGQFVFIAGGLKRQNTALSGGGWDSNVLQLPAGMAPTISPILPLTSGYAGAQPAAQVNTDGTVDVRNEGASGTFPTGQFFNFANQFVLG